ncbi:MAG: hypothetical protein U5J98_04335 [Halobacteriales archaeon]|nr:hypothetical protein [Halobacteriales archaeon]
MARAPPSDDSEPELIEFGIPVLDDRLEAAEVSFPVDRAELRTTMGGHEIPYDAGGGTIRLGQALERVDVDRFETKNELLDALHPVFEERRQRAPSGLVGAIRSYLPF